MNDLVHEELSDQEFGLFRKLIHDQTGIALSDAKRQLVKSRLQKRLRLHSLKSYGEYYEMVVAEGAGGNELRELINCITTNKTDFFREPHHFRYVQEQIIPDLQAKARMGRIPRKLRVWHAGCSTGEEPYTLAMVLSEHLHKDAIWDARQLASDIDTNVLAHAAAGVYEEEKVLQIPENLQRKYLLRGKDKNSSLYKVRDSLKERIAFRQINLLEDPWPIRSDVQFDMIFCRNVVIYFDKDTQRKLFRRFQGVLKPGGHLFIGHSENLLGISTAYDSVGGTIYRLPEAEKAAVA